MAISGVVSFASRKEGIKECHRQHEIKQVSIVEQNIMYTEYAAIANTIHIRAAQENRGGQKPSSRWTV